MATLIHDADEDKVIMVAISFGLASGHFRTVNSITKDLKTNCMNILKHKQTLTVAEHGHGNCYQATLACLLNVPIHKVPDFALWFNHRIFEGNYHWFNLVQDWLINNYKVKEVHSNKLTMYHKKLKSYKSFPHEYKDKPYMISGLSPRGAFNHVVIYMNGEMIHDVHPDGTGVIMNDDIDCTILKSIE